MIEHKCKTCKEGIGRTSIIPDCPCQEGYLEIPMNLDCESKENIHILYQFINKNNKNMNRMLL